MAEYTIELKDVVSNHNIFDFPYAFHDEAKRPDFEQNFIRHFMFREICCPTVDRWKVYLEDKMKTVFPYYNKLMEAATIEYSILDNYNLTEEFSATRDNTGKTSGISSTVGQLIGNQESDTQRNGKVNTSGNADTVGHETEVETSNSVTDATAHEETTSGGTTKTDTTNNQSVEGSSRKTYSETIEDDKHTRRKFLDTPQGLTDLTNSNYITDLTDTTEDGNQEKTGTENTTDTQTTTGGGSSDTTNSGTSEGDKVSNSETNTTRNSERNSTTNQTTEGLETSEDKTIGTVTEEQRTTSDNNTRTYMDGHQTEAHTLKRHGNIGVDTDADMIEKHIKLQQKLTTIERQFFAECEDLFMMVY